MIARLLLALTLVGLSWSHVHYMDMIPNGHRVHNPCTGGIWEGVGHQASSGAGPKNAFGMDFGAHAHSWAAVCHLDSDGDGHTNGQELGDPRCVWAPSHGHGHPAPAPEGLATGHPGFSGLDGYGCKDDGVSYGGICEPIGSAACAGHWSPC